MSNEPTDRDSETATCVFVDRMSRVLCGRTKAEHADLKTRGLMCNPPHDFTSAYPRRASSAEEERAVLAELLRRWNAGEFIARSVFENHCSSPEIDALIDRAREVLARREKEGKDNG